MSAPISGSIWVQGMAEPVKTRGQATLNHAWMDRTESDLVLRQLEVVVADTDLAVFATDFTSPAGQRWRWLVVRRGAEVVYRSEAIEVDLGAPRADYPRYPLPGRISFRNGDVELVATPQRELLRLDPIEVVPQPFRFLLSLKMQPQRAVADAECRLSSSQPAGAKFDGKCLVTATYLNPMP
jgi:hypothetical protein